MGMPIVWQGSDCFTHMLAVGPTRCGKTATILKPMIYQLLLQKKRGVPLGISVVEPKGDVAAMVNEMCLEMDIPCIHVDPTNRILQASIQWKVKRIQWRKQRSLY